MKLQVPFVQLPLRFDADRLAAEIRALGDAAWRPHPQKFPGNFALPLISVAGDPDSDAIAGPMRPTPYLERCPYLSQVLARIGGVWGRTRLMKLVGGAEVTPHADINYYWRDRVRVHVPIQTQPGVRFICGEAEVNMAPGECWIFDTWRPHRVVNVADQERVHLVADTVGSEIFWELIGRGRVPGHQPPEGWRAEPFDDGGAGAPVQLILESSNVPQVMTPWELRNHMEFILAHTMPHPELGHVQQVAACFMAEWRALWAHYGEDRAGWPAYRRVLNAFAEHMERNATSLQLGNGMHFMDTMRSMVMGVALADGRELPRGDEPRIPATPRASAVGGLPGHAPHGDDTAGPSEEAARTPRAKASRIAGQENYPFDRPVFIVSPPRSGSSLFFETLALSPGVCTIGGESHGLIEGVSAPGVLSAAARGYESNRLEAADASPQIVTALRERFRRRAFDRDGRKPKGRIRLLEKTPKNSLRIPFLTKVFPDALFVYLYRDPREVLASMMEAWESGGFRTYPQLPGWAGLPWSMVLVPGWCELIGKSLPDIVATQWQTTTRILLDDLESLPVSRRCVASYDSLLADPNSEIARVCEAVGFDWDRTLDDRLPVASHTVSAPRREKWRAREQEVERALAQVTETAERAMRVARRRDEPVLT